MLLLGRGHHASPSPDSLGSHDIAQMAVFGAVCQPGSFPPRVTQPGPRPPVCTRAMATRHRRRPRCLRPLPELTAASHCLMQFACDNDNLCSLQRQHGFLMSPRLSPAEGKV